MDHLVDDIVIRILSNLKKRKIKYIPFGDGEQNYTLIYNQLYPYNLVNKKWYKLIKLISK